MINAKEIHGFSMFKVQKKVSVVENKNEKTNTHTRYDLKMNKRKQTQNTHLTPELYWNKNKYSSKS